jgi:hypothetical protein
MRNATHRFWPCIAAAVVVAVIAVPPASAGVHKYNTKLSIAWDNPQNGTALFHGGGGGLQSEVRKCMRGRRVVLFKHRPGADRKFATDRSRLEGGVGGYGVVPPKRTLIWGDRLYAEVKREVRNDGDVCRGDRSETQVFPLGRLLR